MVLESVTDGSLNATRLGILDLMSPVTTSTDGLCVATTKCMPAALASCARLTMQDSTSFLACIMSSESSSMIMSINGSFSGADSSGRVSATFSTFSL